MMDIIIILTWLLKGKNNRKARI